MSTGDPPPPSADPHQITPPPSLPQEFNPSLLRTPLVQARAPEHRVPSQIRRARRKPRASDEPAPPSTASRSASSQSGYDAAESSAEATSAPPDSFSLGPPPVAPLTDRRRSGSSSDWRWSLSTQYRSSQILELGQATPMDINLGPEPREVRIGRLRGSTSSATNRPPSSLSAYPRMRPRADSAAVSDSSLPSASVEYVTATEYTSSDSDEARRRARASVSPVMDPNRALPSLPARYRRAYAEADDNGGRNVPMIASPSPADAQRTHSESQSRGGDRTHRPRSTVESIAKLEDLLNEANNLSFRSSSDLPTSADSAPTINPLETSPPQVLRAQRSFAATPPALKAPMANDGTQVSARDSLSMLNPSPRPLLAPIDPPDMGAGPRHRRRHASSPADGRTAPVSFTPRSLENLMAQNPSPYDLRDIGLPAPERRLLEKFVDSLSNLSVEVQMDEGKRQEGRRRLNNALRALEGWI